MIANSLPIYGVKAFPVYVIGLILDGRLYTNVSTINASDRTRKTPNSIQALLDFVSLGSCHRKLDKIAHSGSESFGDAVNYSTNGRLILGKEGVTRSPQRNSRKARNVK